MNDLKNRKAERGAALYFALVIGVSLMGMATVMVSVSTTTTQENETARKHVVRLDIAESAVRRAISDLNNGGSGTIGSAASPLSFGGGAHWASATDNGDGTHTVVARGTYARGQRAVEAVVQEVGGMFHHAVFAGNESGDASYDLDFGGSGNQADQVIGDVYSGNDIRISGDASITGEARASGSIHGMSGYEGVTQPIPQIAAMNYEVNHDVNVAQEFSESGSFRYDSAGGYAWQVPEHMQSHIFRKNPTDRYTEYSATAKDDFFLEDPYERVYSDPYQNGSSAYQATLTGGGNPGPNGSSRVVFIDGNLWVHNKRTYSLQLKYGGSGGTRVTFVVKGNVYISDNLFVHGGNDSGIAIIAMKDAAVADSGNVYFGDPVFGTLQQMNAFLYAENNFYDNNLDAVGSAMVEVNGMMSAGNHVNINRTWSNGQHSKLTVQFDDRIKNGTLDLPGLPQSSSGGGASYVVVSWREISQ